MKKNNRKKTVRIMFISLSAVFAIPMFSCGGEKYANEEQRNFYAIRREYAKRNDDAKNSVVKQELYDEYKQVICDFFKSIQTKSYWGGEFLSRKFLGPTLNEWEGRIEDIKFDDRKKELTFIIKFESYNQRTDFNGIIVMNPMSFSPDFYWTFSPDEILLASEGSDFDKIYNTVKTLNDSDTVIFSGNILHDYENCELGELSSIYFLRLFIYITDLRKK